MKHRHIPATWTAQQALQVTTFLQELIEDIWDMHGVAMGHLLEERDAQRRLQNEQELLPF